MKIGCIRHVTFEGPGIITEWAEEMGFELDVVKIWEGESLPKAESLDGLIIMGGPMSAYDDDKYPWLHAEKNLIANAIDLGVPVLGICLGAQIIAHVLGAKVYPNEHKEIGWFPVEICARSQGNELLRNLPVKFNTFQWHGDTFDLPNGATLLMRSEACTHQAFVKGKALGLQFHMEMTKEGVEELSDRCAHELVEAPYIQQRDELINKAEFALNHKLLRQLLNVWVRM